MSVHALCVRVLCVCVHAHACVLWGSARVSAQLLAPSLKVVICWSNPKDDGRVVRTRNLRRERADFFGLLFKCDFKSGVFALESGQLLSAVVKLRV